MSNVREFGAVGDGMSDDTAALQHAIADADGVLEFPRGDYRIARPLVVELAEHGPIALTGRGGTARLIMNGAGPALILRGTHTTTADPAGFRPQEWQRERMPTISGLEILGRHAEADGVRIEGVMQATLTGLLIREVRTAVHVRQRARNLLVSHCHIYNNTGVGIHLDQVDLHQTIITGSHISYCRLGGVRVEGSEIRNLQITGNDIEYNNNRSHKIAGEDDRPTAEIFIDASRGSVREGTISGNTLQATYSRGGANIRFIGRNAVENHKTGLWTITGNLIGSQENNIHLTSARGMTITGNVIYSGHERNLLIENSRNIAIAANVFDHNPDYGPLELCTGIRLVDCVDCNLTGLVIQDSQAGKPTIANAIPIVREGLVELVRCRRMNLSGLQLLEGTPYGIYLEDCHDTLIGNCTILDQRQPNLMQAALRWKGPGTGNLVSHCRLGTGLTGAIIADAQITQSGNLIQ